MLQRLTMSGGLPALTLLVTTGCAESMPVPAEADEIEAAVKRADENALSAKSGTEDRTATR